MVAVMISTTVGPAATTGAGAGACSASLWLQAASTTVVVTNAAIPIGLFMCASSANEAGILYPQPRTLIVRVRPPGPGVPIQDGTPARRCAAMSASLNTLS